MKGKLAGEGGTTLFEPDLLLPAQFFAALKQKAQTRGERRLMIAILEDAIVCFQKNLWAPWRMDYISGLGVRGDECFLCRAVAQPQDDERNYVLWRGPQTITILNLFPYNSGHLLIAPTTHLAGLEELTDDALLELIKRTRDAKRVLEDALHAQGFNIGINIGHCAGAGLPGHLHVHVVPRWAGDTNFMTVLGDVKVIPQALAETRRVFLESAARLGLPQPS